MTPFCLYSILVFISINACFGQTPTLENPVPITPNASAIIQYGNVPVGLYTGQPSINFPLYEINTGYLKFPISLSYNYNGLKVEDYPSWVGAGWTLNAGGVITRQTISLPDESPNGFSKNRNELLGFINAGANPSDPTYSSLLTKIIRKGLVDTEPDIFIFSAPGLSGKFYFDDDLLVSPKTAISIPHQSLQIKGYFDYGYVFNTLRGRINKFEITDERGNLYTFDIQQRVGEAIVDDSDDGSPAPEFQNTWTLSKIEDPFGHTIDFTYKARKIAMPYTVSELLLTPEYFSSSKVYNRVDNWEVILEKITFRNGYIEFVEEESTRLDWNSAAWPDFTPSNQEEPKALASVRVTVGNNVVKQFKFNYGYFGNNDRLMLNSFQELNGTILLPPHRFTYNAGQFPKIGSKTDLLSQDHWGYYTGGSNSTLLPPFSFTTQEGAFVFLNGNFRSPTAASSAGLLTSIQYPTGGTTNFVYEPNDYDPSLSSFSPPSANCDQELVLTGSVSVRFDVPPANDKIKEKVILLNFSRDVCAKFNYGLSVGSCIDNSASVMLKRASTGEIILSKILHLTAGPQGISSNGSGFGSDEVFKLTAGQYELTASVECIYCADPLNFKAVEASISLYTSSDQDPQAITKRTAGGYRVKEIKDCAIGPVSGCHSKYFSYTDPITGKSSGALVSYPIYEYQTKYLKTFSAPSTADPERTVRLPIEIIVVSSGSQIPILSTLGNSVGYRTVSVADSPAGSNGKSLYQFSSAVEFPDGNSPIYPFAPGIEEDYMRGFQKSEQHFIYTNTNYLLQKEVNVDLGQRYFRVSKGIKLGSKYFNIGDGVTNKIWESIWGSGSSIIDTYQTNVESYLFTPYTIRSGWKTVPFQRELTHNLANGTQLETVTSFSYENDVHRLITKKEVTNSIGQKMKTSFSYRDDLAKIVGLSSNEIEGIQACPDQTAVIEEKQFRDDVLISTKRNLFHGPTIAKMQQSFGSSQLQDVAVFSDYDNDGNVKSFTTKTGDIHSYIYGYNNTLPVAHAINAKVTDIYYSSFEELISGSNPNAKSGKYSLRGNSFTFPRDFSPSNVTNMKMSYWYWDNDKWNFSNELPFSFSFTAPGTLIDEVRAYPARARMITFCYKPGVGMISKIDENNIAQHFQYDQLGRLISASDDRNNLINAHDYYYKNEN